MRRLLIAILLLVFPAVAREPLARRIVKPDPATYRSFTAVHGGAGEFLFAELLGTDVFSTNLDFVHRGVLQPKGGIGHHVHSYMEEMFVIFDNEAEFTVNGRTSRIVGPAIVPCRMGSSHAIYNPTGRPTQWMNIGVFSRKGKYDAFDLGDDRVGVQLDQKPVFINSRLDKSLLQPVESLHGGKGVVRYRRVFGPTVFFTNWAYVDHLVLPPGTSAGKKSHEGVEEFYYVMDGSGLAHVNDESAAIQKDNGVPILVKDVHSFENNGTGDLELLIIGVAREKWNLDTVEVK